MYFINLSNVLSILQAQEHLIKIICFVENLVLLALFCLS